MARITATHALLPGGWVRDVAVTLGADGTITGVETGVAGAQVRILLPAPANLHSHSFQRAMAGRTEVRAGQDSFWSWRSLMYRFVERLTPEAVEAIAAQTFLEMLEAGYAAVAEFHYLHHRPDGTPYADPAEMSRRIRAAAATVGIGLTLLPVLYTHGGTGGQPLAGGQRAFGHTPEAFLRLVERLAADPAPPDHRLGIAPHSLRATTPGGLAAVLPHAPGPIHMHIAEQPREVAEVEAWLGARPVAWALDHLPLGPDWCLIHATHMTAAETAGLARTGAVAGLCPITEANLGDGPFPGPDFLAAGGAIGIGSDSNVRIALAEELRTLEYSQRQRDIARTVMAGGDGSTGHSLFTRILAGGAQALGRPAGAIAPGRLGDLVALDAAALAFHAVPPPGLLDAWIFAADDRVVRDVWSAGRHVVQDGRHRARDAVAARFRAALDGLG